MGKKSIHVTVDEDVHKEAIEKGINVSSIADLALYEKVKGKQVVIEEALSCHDCNVEMEKQTVEDLTKGLVWLYPDERWICPRCLRNRFNSVSI